MPFYLYGTPKELHLDHIYLRAPNIQLTAGSVQFSLSSKRTKMLAPEELERGMIAIACDLHEDWMQPFTKTDELPMDVFFFRKGNAIRLLLYKDPFEAIYDGKIDLKKLTKPVAEVKVILTDEIYVDSDDLNEDSTFHPIPFGKCNPLDQRTNTVPKRRKVDALSIIDERCGSVARTRQQCHVFAQSVKEIPDINSFKSTNVDAQIGSEFGMFSCSK